MREFHKKGMGLTLVAALVVMAVIIVVFIAFINSSAKAAQKAEHNLHCKKAVELFASSGGLQGFAGEIGVSKVTDADKGIDCPTQFIPVKGSEPDDIKREAAYHISHCWDNYGRGKLQVFRPEDTTFCSICSVLEFKKRGQNIEGFTSYLAKKEIPKDIPLRGEVRPTHLEFITGKQPTKEEVASWSGSSDVADTIHTDADYAAIYTFYRQSFWDKFKAAVHVGGGGAAAGFGVAVVLVATGVVSGGTVPAAIVLGAALTGGGIGAAAGDDPDAENWEAGVIFVPYTAESLQEFGCQYIENR